LTVVGLARRQVSMEISEIKNKIVEVWAAARVIVQKFGHTKKFAKHIAALVIRQCEKFNDVKLVEFLGRDPIGRMLGYRKRPDETTFSKVRERMDPQILEELQSWIVSSLLKGKQLKLIAQDSTDVPAYSEKDKEAKWGHRTPSRKEQLLYKSGNEKDFFYGYKPHMIVDAETDTPIAVEIVSANTNDKKLFDPVYRKVKSITILQHQCKYLADAEYHSSHIRTTLRNDNLVPVIPFSGNKWQKTENPKDPDYGKRWAVERVFSRLKEVFGLENNRFFGLRKVKIHVFSCVLAYLLRYKM
jgi:IS5 family transposase